MASPKTVAQLLELVPADALYRAAVKVVGVQVADARQALREAISAADDHKARYSDDDAVRIGHAHFAAATLIEKADALTAALDRLKAVSQ